MVNLQSILLTASALCGAAAQTTTTDGSAATSTTSGSSSTGTPKVHRVNIGAGGYMYDPNVTIADVGDIVTFVFYPTNHSVIRGEYTGSEICGSGGCNPCVPYNLIHGEGGFNSSNIEIQNIPASTSISDETKTFNVTIFNLDPIWYYCNALSSCNPNGMVGVINPANGQDVSTQKEAAVKAPYQLAPSDAWPAEGQPVGAETATVSGLSPQTSVPSSPTASSTSATSSSSDHHNLSGGAIAGIVIGGVAILLLAAALFYYVGRSKAYKDAFHGSGKSDAAGPSSNVGEKSEHVAHWMPPPPGGASSTSGYTDNRYSYMTQPPQGAGPRDSSFVGYNRQTGEPEFAGEAPMQRPNHQSWNSHTSPYMPQGGFTPPMPTGTPHNQPAVEMMGDSPQRVEIGKSS